MLNKFFKFRHGAIFSVNTIKQHKKKKFQKVNNINHELISNNGLLLRYKKRLEEGHKFYCFFKKKKVVAYYWISEKKAPLAFGNYIILPKRFIYIWGCYVLKKYRRRGLYKIMLNEAKDTAKKEGKIKLLISSNVENDISTKAIFKCGFQKLKEYKFYQFLNLKIVLINNKFQKMFINNVILKL